MDNYNVFRIYQAFWMKRVVAGRVIYQCSECGNVDDPTKKICVCCRSEMEVGDEADCKG